jgi:hypothetical protein
MAEHIVEGKKILRFVNTGFRVTPKSVEIIWAEIYWGRLFFRAESSLIQSSCRSFIRVIVPYERGYETSGSPLRFMLRRSSLVECVTRKPVFTKRRIFFPSTICTLSRKEQ